MYCVSNFLVYKVGTMSQRNRMVRYEFNVPLDTAGHFCDEVNEITVNISVACLLTH